MPVWWKVMTIILSVKFRLSNQCVAGLPNKSFINWCLDHYHPVCRNNCLTTFILGTQNKFLHRQEEMRQERQEPMTKPRSIICLASDSWTALLTGGCGLYLIPMPQHNWARSSVCYLWSESVEEFVLFYFLFYFFNVVWFLFTWKEHVKKLQANQNVSQTTCEH